jgi:pyruvate/2-oxoglutarate dehydrogenase complex dihydrolipoamide acyltransferase (E2) component
MAKKKTPRKQTQPKAKASPKKAAPKKAAAVPKMRRALESAGVDCVDAPTAQSVVDGCMTNFGVGTLSKSTKISDALPGRINAFCACIRTSSGVTSASCNGGMTFQQVEVALVCP